MQTNLATTERKKPAKCRPFPERLKGFEPSTFCMASRNPVFPGRRAYSLQTREFSAVRSVPRFHGYYREFTG